HEAERVKRPAEAPARAEQEAEEEDVVLVVEVDRPLLDAACDDVEHAVREDVPRQPGHRKHGTCRERQRPPPWTNSPTFVTPRPCPFGPRPGTVPGRYRFGRG